MFFRIFFNSLSACKCRLGNEIYGNLLKCFRKEKNLESELEFRLLNIITYAFIYFTTCSLAQHYFIQSSEYYFLLFTPVHLKYRTDFKKATASCTVIIQTMAGQYN